MAALVTPTAALIALFAPLAAMLLVAPVPSASSCIDGTRLVSPQFTPPDFGYTGEKGPLNWHGLKKEYEKCARGWNQSPINIVPGSHGIKSVGPAERPIIDYPKAPGELENLGNTIEVHADGLLQYNGAKWELRQFHFHTPSEHRFKEEYFPIEVHFVHERVGDAAKLVLGLFLDFKESSAPSTNFDCTLRTLLNKARDVPAPGDKTDAGTLDFGGLAAHVVGNALYQYSGSLTTPPCHEGVTWLVSSEPLQLDVRAFSAAKDVLRFNSRVTQNYPGLANLIEVAAKSLTKTWFAGVRGGLSVIQAPVRRVRIFFV